MRYNIKHNNTDNNANTEVAHRILNINTDNNSNTSVCVVIRRIK
jgi:hypothetical protein